MEKYPRHSKNQGKNSLPTERKNKSRDEREVEQLIQEHIEYIEKKKSK